MEHTVTVTVTFKVLADDCAKAEHAAFDAIDAMPNTDCIIGTSYSLDDSTICQHGEDACDCGVLPGRTHALSCPKCQLGRSDAPI